MQALYDKLEGTPENAALPVNPITNRQDALLSAADPVGCGQ